jgi:isoquinoline 1-oxidoreductase subunit beta
MTTALQVSRRKFLAGSTAATAGLSLGFHVPLAGNAAAQGAMAPEVKPGW